MIRRRSLLASGVLFLVLLLAAGLLLRSPEEETVAPWFALARGVPDTLTVVVPPDSTVLVPGGPTGWRLVAPVEDEADPLVVEAMLRRLEGVQPLRTFPFTEEKRDTYGFRFPRAILRAAYADGLPPDTLLVGGFSLDGSLDYVRAGETGEVALVPSRETRTYLVRRPFDLRHRELLPFHETRARRVTTYGPGGDVLADLVREDEGWRLEKPFPGAADPRQVRDYLMSISHMDARSVVRDGPGPVESYGLAEPAARFRVVTLAGDTLTADLGDPIPGEEDRRYARVGGRPHVWGVPEKYFEVAGSDLAFLRDRRVVGFGQVDLDSLRVENGGARTWTAADWSGADGPSTRLREVIRDWISQGAAGVEADDDASRRRRGLVPPAGRLLWFGKGDTLAVVEVGRARQGRIALALTGGEAARPGEILLVEEAFAGPLWRRLSGEAGP